MGWVNRWRVYIKPFDEDGNYSDWIEVTSDLEAKLTEVKQDLDNDTYQIGVYRNSNLTLSLNNSEGKYGDVDDPRSIFRYKRSDSLVKVTWEVEADGPYAGDAVVGKSILSEEMTLFTGLLSDESATMDLSKQVINFVALGRESLFERVTVPAGVANGDLISAAVYKCLNQTLITDQLEVNALNITLGADVTLDDVSNLQTSTVKEALGEFLLMSNSVLRISNDAIIVSPRDPTASVQYTFYGQGSFIGVENITALKNIRSGLARVYNYLSWQENPTPTKDQVSIDIYGVRKKELSASSITNSTKQATLMQAIVDEFSYPKLELDLSAPLDYNTLDLDLLDRITIDYPKVYIPYAEGLPICGYAICGAARLPKTKWAFFLDSTRNFKITGRALSIKDGVFTYKLREV
jgi:hypothetical protein